MGVSFVPDFDRRGEKLQILIWLLGFAAAPQIRPVGLGGISQARPARP
jgi:hypothetical protein